MEPTRISHGNKCGTHTSGVNRVAVGSSEHVLELSSDWTVSVVLSSFIYFLIISVFRGVGKRGGVQRRMGAGERNYVGV